jgi:hypothetical protein
VLQETSKAIMCLQLCSLVFLFHKLKHKSEIYWCLETHLYYINDTRIESVNHAVFFLWVLVIELSEYFISLFIYSYVHTLFGRFLPPAPNPSIFPLPPLLPGRIFS